MGKGGLFASGLVDRDGLIWFGCWSQGILKECRKKRRFEYYTLNEEGLETGPFFEDREGRIWIIGSALAIFLPESSKIIDFTNLPEYQNEIDFTSILGFAQQKETVWFGSMNGLFKTQLAFHPKVYENLALGKKVFAFSLTSDPKIEAFALHDYASDGNKFTMWCSAPVDSAWIVIDLEEKAQINKIVIHWADAVARQFAIQESDDMVNWRTVYKESSGKGGTEVIFLNAKGRYIRFQGIERSSPYGYHLYEIEVYGPSPKIVHYKHSPNDTTTIPSDHTMGLFFDKKENLWIATPDRPAKYDPQKDQFIPYALLPPSNFVLLKEDSRGRAWLNNLDDQLYAFDLTNASIKSYRTKPGDTTSISHWQALSVLEDKNETLWFGTAAGINRYNYDQDNFTRFLRDQYIHTIYQCSNGYIWIGTSNGLFRLDPASYEFKSYRQKDGLPHLLIRSIIEDNQGRLWIGTSRGLSCFYPEKERFVNYSENDGLPRNPFYVHCLKDSRGFLYFGGSGTLTVFNPETISDDATIPQVVISDLQIDRRTVHPNKKDSPLTKDITVTDQIRLKHFQNVLTLGFTALHYDNSKGNLYKVKMEGVNKNWVFLGTQRQIDYSGLTPGEYTFLVKGANSDGVWNETPASLKITILPPWWWNAWTKTLYLLVALSLLYGLYRFQLKRQLAIAEAQRLKELDTFKTRLYTNITHEFRTPLTIILGMVDQIKKDPREWFSEGLQMIKRSGKNLLHLVNQMLDLSKLESGTMSLNTVQEDIIVYLKYLFESFHSMAESKEIELQFNSVPESLMMDYDPDKVLNIVFNLMSNAIKYTPQGGSITLNVNKKQGRGEHLEVRIKDTGIGIPKDNLPYVFDRFYQAKEGANKAGGTGIGLAIVKELISLKKGRITVKSKEGKGTEFNILLPITNNASLSEVPFSAGIKEQLSSEMPLRKVEKDEKIIRPQEKPLLLIVEDNVDVVTYLSSFLRQDYQLLVANNGAEGIDKAIKNIPDIIISDVMMPVKDGFELCQMLKKDERCSHIPFVLLTAKADAASKYEGLELGADAYLPKPVIREELKLRLRKLLESRKKLQEYYSKIRPLSPVDKKYIREDTFIKKLHKILEANLNNENFDVKALSCALFISRMQLHRKLKALTGKSAAQYLRSFRLHKAKEMLLATDKPISEIAYDVGFKAPSYFATSFAEEYGFSPREFRK